MMINAFFGMHGQHNTSSKKWQKKIIINSQLKIGGPSLQKKF